MTTDVAPGLSPLSLKPPALCRTFEDDNGVSWLLIRYAEDGSYFLWRSDDDAETWYEVSPEWPDRAELIERMLKLIEAAVVMGVATES